MVKRKRERGGGRELKEMCGGPSEVVGTERRLESASGLDSNANMARDRVNDPGLMM
jgi:hypothetical protein